MPPCVPKSARRFAQLVKELNQAILDNDPEHESRLYPELESIVALMGDNHPEVERRTVSRERKRIVAAINRSLEKIGKHDPGLARALGGALKMRASFSYSPKSTGPETDDPDPEPESKKPPRRD
jgi:hypothetical protein